MGVGIDQRRGSDGQRGPHGTNVPRSNPGKHTLTEQLPTLIDRAPGNGSGSPGVQRKPGDTAPQQQPAGTHVDRLIQLLAVPPAAGRDDVYTLLLSLSMPELLATMEGVADCGYLPQLRAR